MHRIILVLVFVLVIPFADFTTVEESSKSNKSTASDNIEKAARILNDFHDVVNYLTSNFAGWMLPTIMEIAEEVNVSRSCMECLMHLLTDLKQNKGWTLKWLDSLGNPFGIFNGKLWLHGDYDQCLNIEVKNEPMTKNDKKVNTMHGKFCALTIGFNSYEFSDVPEENKSRKFLRMMKDIVKPYPLSTILEIANYTKLVFRVDICIPSTCSREDVESILQWAIKDTYRAEVKFCKVKDDKVRFSATQIICIFAIGIFITWVSIGTFLQTLITINIVDIPCGKGDILQNFVSVSLISSTQKLFSTDFNNETRFFSGIKYLLMCIVVFGHIFIYCGFKYTTVDKLSNLLNISDDVLMAILPQGLCMLETFFFISGFLTFYLRRNNEEKSLLYYFIFFIKRYIRMTFPLLCLLVFLIILPLCGEGPHWDLVHEEAERAEQYWWRYILHSQNLVNQRSHFTAHTWFLNVLMQLTVITVPLLYIHDRWPTFGNVLLYILTVAGIVSHACYSLHTKYATMFGLSINLENLDNFFIYMYVKPYFSHLSSYCLGLLIGNVLLKKKQLKLRKTIVLSCWIVTICLMGLVFFGLHNYKTDPSPNESIIVVHQILSPIVWIAVTAWICVACISGYAGVVNKFLSLNFFVVMDRLIFWIYLLHPVVFLYIFGKIRSPYSFTEINLWMLFLLLMSLSLIGAIFCYMFLQIPMTYFLLECLFKKNYKKKYL